MNNLGQFTREELEIALINSTRLVQELLHQLKRTAFFSRLQPFSDKLGLELFEQKRREFTKMVGLSPTREDDIFDLFSKFTETTTIWAQKFFIVFFAKINVY